MSEDDRELYNDLDAARRKLAGNDWTLESMRQLGSELEAALYAEEEALLEEGTPCAKC